VGRLPLGGAYPLADIRGVTEDSTEKAAGGVQGAGNRAKDEWLETRAVAVAATIAIELELEAVIGALIGVIAGELDFLAHG
jgi:hypothetical protein